MQKMLNWDVTDNSYVTLKYMVKTEILNYGFQGIVVRTGFHLSYCIGEGFNHQSIILKIELDYKGSVSGWCNQYTMHYTSNIRISADYIVCGWSDSNIVYNQTKKKAVFFLLNIQWRDTHFWSFISFLSACAMSHLHKM